MRRIAMARKDDNLVPSLLQANRCVDDQPLCPAYPQVRVKKDNCLLLFLVLGHFGEFPVRTMTCVARNQRQTWS